MKEPWFQFIVNNKLGKEKFISAMRSIDYYKLVSKCYSLVWRLKHFKNWNLTLQKPSLDTLLPAIRIELTMTIVDFFVSSVYALLP